MPLLRPSELDDVAWLRKRYVDEKRSIRQIAQELDCHRGMVERAMERCGIHKRSGPAYPRLDDVEWLRASYEDEFMTSDQIAALVGCHGSAVRQALRRHGIDTRSAGETTRRRAMQELQEDVVARLTSESWMREMYAVRRLSMSQIAAILGCTTGMVDGSLKALGISPRAVREAGRVRVGIDDETSRRLDDEHWLREAYVGQMRSVRDIASQLGVHDGMVYRALIRNGISPRSWSGARRAYDRAARNGYDLQRQRRMKTLAKDAGDVGRAYTSVIKILGQLDRVPFSNREAARLENEAMDGLYRAQDALAQRLLLGQGD